jgi:uncharacterized membrane protein YjjP (DUF1212 family)
MALMVAALAVSGCENRVGQCNKLIEVINTEGNKLKVSSDAAGLKKMADDLDAAAKKLEAVDITIDKLKGYRDEYKNFMVDFSKAARAFAEMQSGEAADPKKSQDALANLNTSLQKSSKLTDDINNYCQGKSQ